MMGQHVPLAATLPWRRSLYFWYSAQSRVHAQTHHPRARPLNKSISTPYLAKTHWNSWRPPQDVIKENRAINQNQTRKKNTQKQPYNNPNTTTTSFSTCPACTKERLWCCMVCNITEEHMFTQKTPYSLVLHVVARFDGTPGNSTALMALGQNPLLLLKQPITRTTRLGMVVFAAVRARACVWGGYFLLNVYPAFTNARTRIRIKLDSKQNGMLCRLHVHQSVVYFFPWAQGADRV